MRSSAIPTTAAVLAPSRAYWYCQAVGWTLYAIFNAVVFASFRGFSADIVLITLVIALTLLGVTHGLRYYLRARNWVQLAPLPLLGRLLVANLLLSALSQVIIWGLIYWVVRPAPGSQPQSWGQFVSYAFNVNLLLWLWEGFYFGWHFLSRSRQAEIDKWKLMAAVREAEMRTLKA